MVLLLGDRQLAGGSRGGRDGEQGRPGTGSVTEGALVDGDQVVGGRGREQGGGGAPGRGWSYLLEGCGGAGRLVTAIVVNAQALTLSEDLDTNTLSVYEYWGVLQ